MVAWIALALALLELCFLAGFLLAARHYWRQAAPAVAPLLAMFSAPATAPPSSAPAARDVDPHGPIRS